MTTEGAPPPPPPRASPQRATTRLRWVPRGYDNSIFMDLGTFKQIYRTVPWMKRPRKWWDLCAILVGLVSAFVWFAYTFVQYLDVAHADLLSSMMMAGIPLIIVVFRKPIDSLLIPVRQYREKIPRLIRIGIGIAIPFLSAYILYYLVGMIEYQLMHWNLIIGIFLSYVIARDPIPARAYQLQKRSNLKSPLLIIFLLSICVVAVSAHDCGGDIFNAQDCLRTEGIAEWIAGFFGALLGGILNAGFPRIKNCKEGQSKLLTSVTLRAAVSNDNLYDRAKKIGADLNGYENAQAHFGSDLSDAFMASSQGDIGSDLNRALDLYTDVVLKGSTPFTDEVFEQFKNEYDQNLTGQSTDTGHYTEAAHADADGIEYKEGFRDRYTKTHEGKHDSDFPDFGYPDEIPHDEAIDYASNLEKRAHDEEINELVKDLYSLNCIN